MNKETKFQQRDDSEIQLITCLPPEPWVAGNSPVSSSRYPLDSASNLNLQQLKMYGNI